MAQPLARAIIQFAIAVYCNGFKASGTILSRYAFTLALVSTVLDGVLAPPLVAQIVSQSISHWFHACPTILGPSWRLAAGLKTNKALGQELPPWWSQGTVRRR